VLAWTMALLIVAAQGSLQSTGAGDWVTVHDAGGVRLTLDRASIRRGGGVAEVWGVQRRATSSGPHDVRVKFLVDCTAARVRYEAAIPAHGNSPARSQPSSWTTVDPEGPSGRILHTVCGRGASSAASAAALPAPIPTSPGHWLFLQFRNTSAGPITAIVAEVGGREVLLYSGCSSCTREFRHGQFRTISGGSLPQCTVSIRVMRGNQIIKNFPRHNVCRDSNFVVGGS
jgi:hypothetical protein